MIPKNISRIHVLKAIQEIDVNGIPENRISRKYALIYLEKHYPPKYVIALANVIANGKLLSSDHFGGGIESNTFLESRGFEIGELQIANSPKDIQPSKNNSKPKPRLRHNERCKDCKKSIEKMLEVVYGKVETNHRFDIGVFPDDYLDSPFHAELSLVYKSLQDFRGNNSFVITSKLPHVDYFVPNPGFVIEFDESQHFTAARKISLVNYPPDFKTGFNTNKWISLCETIDAKDNDPPYRDEQRAWYDTLRDFLPTIKQLQTTVRLYSKSFHWCRLDSNNPSDQKIFESILDGENLDWNIEVYEDSDPSLARIVIAGDWIGEKETSKQLLHDVCDLWPSKTKVNFLITCGAFLTFDWPSELTNIGDNKFPDKKIINQLISHAEMQCKLLLDEDLRKELAAHADYITIGIDSFKERISLSNVSIRQPHIEMISLVDLRSGNYYWTGKSYPTSGQENGLIRFQDLETHFIDLPFGKVMILGCHDLSIFSPRGAAVTRNEWRIQTREDFYSLSNTEMPAIVLHHPHTTDSSGIWTASWNELNRSLPSVEWYLSAGRYYNNGERQRSHIDDVRQKTKNGNTIDFVVWIKDN